MGEELLSPRITLESPDQEDTMVVWKYDIPERPSFALTMPRDAEILHVAVQHGTPRLWARVDPDAFLELRLFVTAGTGHLVEPGPVHIGSLLVLNGDLVFHLFEIRP